MFYFANRPSDNLSGPICVARKLITVAGQRTSTPEGNKFGDVNYKKTAAIRVAPSCLAFGDITLSTPVAPARYDYRGQLVRLRWGRCRG